MRSESMLSAGCALWVAVVMAASFARGQALPAFELDDAWKQKVAAAAPRNPQVAPARERKVLVFSLATGFRHWCIPHTEAVVGILGERSGAYTTEASRDVEVFRPERLRGYDAVVLNNNCPRGDKRDFFHDVLVAKIGEEGARYAEMPLEQRQRLARELYRSLVDYVAEGGGLVLLHGAIANFANSDEFSMLAGGSFSYHPPQQELSLIPVTPDHPMHRPFGGRRFVHVDEPYVMGRAYDRFLFHPLLELDTAGIEAKGRPPIDALPRYVSWIKRHKEGRVFFCSPSHNAQSFERPELLGFILNGMQYAVGDLACEDRPMKR